jgi:hypothetical protein
MHIWVKPEVERAWQKSTFYESCIITHIKIGQLVLLSSDRTGNFIEVVFFEIDALTTSKKEQHDKE